MNDAESSFYQKLHSHEGPFDGGPKPSLYGAGAGAPEDVPATNGIGAAGAQPVPKKKARKRLYIYGGLATGFVVVGLAASVYVDLNNQRVAARRAPEPVHAADPAPNSVASGGVMGSNGPQSVGTELSPSTVMDTNDRVARVEVASASPQPAEVPVHPVQQVSSTPGEPAVPVATSGQAASATHAPLASAPSQPAMATVGMKPVVLKPSSGEVAESPKIAGDANTPPAQATTDVALMKRLARLEKELAEIRAREGNTSANNAQEPRATRVTQASAPRPAKGSSRAAAKTEVVAKTEEPKSSLREVSRSGEKAGGEHVRVLGVTMRPVGSMALIEFAGVKQRYAEGDSVPGLGQVSSVALHDGQPTVTINGVVYR